MVKANSKSEMVLKSYYWLEIAKTSGASKMAE